MNGPLPSHGLLMVESKLGWMASDSTPVLLMQDADMAQEVETVLSLSAIGRTQEAVTTSHRQSPGQVGAGHSREAREGQSC